MRVKSYKVLCDAVEAGINYGYRRAHKHEDNPNEASILDSVFMAVMDEIAENFTFDEELNNEYD